MGTMWKEFPEINRKVAFVSSFVGPYHSLGCHCGSIAGVTANFGNSYYAANNGANIEVLDTSKEPPIVYNRDYGGMMVPPFTESLKVAEHLRKLKLKFADFGERVYEGIVHKCSNIPLWVMSDAINYEAPARKHMIDNASTVYEVIGHTSDFVKYLIDKKIGYIMASPIVQNPLHRNKKNYSLNQGWFWIHPNHLERAIDVAQVYGDDKFPKKEDWLNVVGGDFGLNVELTPEEDILKRVLNDGVFPIDKRFKKRSSDGRFAKVTEA